MSTEQTCKPAFPPRGGLGSALLVDYREPRDGPHMSHGLSHEFYPIQKGNTIDIILSPFCHIDKALFHSQRWREDISVSPKTSPKWKFWQTFLSYWLRQRSNKNERMSSLKNSKQILKAIGYKFNT